MFTYFSQGVGVTATLPHTVPHYLPLNEAGSDEWFYCGNRLWHNQSSTEFPNIPSLSIHQKIGLQISINGQLNLFIDEQHMGCIAAGLPVKTPLWGVVDVYGYSTEIKSEMLSGELDDTFTRNVINKTFGMICLISCRKCGSR